MEGDVITTTTTVATTEEPPESTESLPDSTLSDVLTMAVLQQNLGQMETRICDTIANQRETLKAELKAEILEALSLQNQNPNPQPEEEEKEEEGEAEVVVVAAEQQPEATEDKKEEAKPRNRWF